MPDEAGPECSGPLFPCPPPIIKPCSLLRRFLGLHRQTGETDVRGVGHAWALKQGFARHLSRHATAEVDTIFAHLAFEWSPNPELAAAVQQGHHVEQTFVVTLRTVGYRRAPKFLDEIFPAGVGRGKTGHGVHGNQSLRMASFQWLAFKREHTAVVCPL
jgi:hypothetical protein